MEKRTLIKKVLMFWLIIALILPPNAMVSAAKACVDVKHINEIVKSGIELDKTADEIYRDLQEAYEESGVEFRGEGIRKYLKGYFGKYAELWHLKQVRFDYDPITDEIDVGYVVDWKKLKEAEKKAEKEAKQKKWSGLFGLTAKIKETGLPEKVNGVSLEHLLAGFTAIDHQEAHLENLLALSETVYRNMIPKLGLEGTEEAEVKRFSAVVLLHDLGKMYAPEISKLLAPMLLANPAEVTLFQMVRPEDAFKGDNVDTKLESQLIRHRENLAKRGLDEIALYRELRANAEYFGLNEHVENYPEVADEVPDEQLKDAFIKIPMRKIYQSHMYFLDKIVGEAGSELRAEFVRALEKRGIKDAHKAIETARRHHKFGTFGGLHPSGSMRDVHETPVGEFSDLDLFFNILDVYEASVTRGGWSHAYAIEFLEHAFSETLLAVDEGKTRIVPEGTSDRERVKGKIAERYVRIIRDFDQAVRTTAKQIAQKKRLTNSERKFLSFYGLELLEFVTEETEEETERLQLQILDKFLRTEGTRVAEPEIPVYKAFLEVLKINPKKRDYLDSQKNRLRKELRNPAVLQQIVALVRGLMSDKVGLSQFLSRFGIQETDEMKKNAADLTQEEWQTIIQVLVLPKGARALLKFNREITPRAENMLREAKQQYKDGLRDSVTISVDSEQLAELQGTVEYESVAERRPQQVTRQGFIPELVTIRLAAAASVAGIPALPGMTAQLAGINLHPKVSRVIPLSAHHEPESTTREAVKPKTQQILTQIQQEETVESVGKADVESLGESARRSFIEILRSDPAKKEQFIRNYQGYVDQTARERSIDDIIKEIYKDRDEHSAEVSFTVQRKVFGLSRTIDVRVSFSFDSEGNLVMEYTPLKPPIDLESRVKDAEKILDQVAEKEDELLKLYKDQGKGPKSRTSGIENDHELSKKIKNLKDEISKMLTRGSGGSREVKVGDSYRALTTGEERFLSDAVFINAEHLEQQKQGVEAIIRDMLRSPPDAVIYSGRGGYPYETAVSSALHGIPGYRVLSSSAVAGKDGAYSGFEDKIKEIIWNTGTSPVKIAIVEGAEFSGSSVADLKNFLRRFGKQLKSTFIFGNVNLEITIYTLRHNQERDHLEHRGKLTQASERKLEGTGITVRHKRFDVPFVLGEDAGLMLGQLPDTTRLNGHVPIIIFKDGQVVKQINAEDTTTHQEFSKLLSDQATYIENT